MLAKTARNLLTLGALWALLSLGALAQEAGPPKLRVAILGTPTHQVAWTDAALEKLKSYGFNAIQLNIAWGSRPFGEPLNLIDVVTAPGEAPLPGTAARGAELERRAAMAKRHGLRTLFQFGSPPMNRNPYTGVVSSTPYRIDDVTYDSWYDILNPRVREHEIALLRTFRQQFLDVDDILVYTYDQNAWQTAEFQDSKYSYGIPLSDRLPRYLAALHDVWTTGRTGKVMWWEPWELSAGEVYVTLPKLPRKDFGLIIHSNIAEAQLAMPVDVWFRNTARMCRDLGIPVVAESFFASATEEIEPLLIPAPRLVDEEYQAFTGVPGIVGIKEYYGINTDVPDLSLDLLRARLRAPSRSTQQLLREVTTRFGPAQDSVRKYLGFLSDALQVYPWDASWHAREAGRASTDHGWHAASIQGLMAPTPSWESTRRAHFMMTDNEQSPFWMLEDVQLRCEVTARLLQRAIDLGGHFVPQLPRAADRMQFNRIQKDAGTLRRVVLSYALHIRESNVAQMLRHDLSVDRPMTPALEKELGQLLNSDVANQNGMGRVVEMRRLYRENPEAFVRQYLIPVEPEAGAMPAASPDLPPINVSPPEKGVFTLTTR